jgi:hypothetical protein
MSATLLESSSSANTLDSQTADARNIGSNVAPWSSVFVPFFSRPEETPAGQVVTRHEPEDEEAAWLRFTQRSRDGWLRENPY